MGSTVIIPVGPYSDGDSTCVPKSQDWRLVDPPHIYLNKIAELWANVQGIEKPGVKYYLDKLPAGYRLYERPRKNHPKIIDKHLYGHPGQGRVVFDSPNRFFPHFLHLMNNKGSNVGCDCSVCTGVRSNGPSSKVRSAPNAREWPQDKQYEATSRPQYAPATKPLTDSEPQSDSMIPRTLASARARVDEEDTPDTIRKLLDRLKLGPVDENIAEDLSLDWRASKTILNEWLSQVKSQPTWLPRQGEIVLFVRDLNGNQIDFNNSQGIYSLFSEKEGRFVGPPVWEAGVIGQGSSETVTLEEMVHETAKMQNVAYSGFRIEPISDCNSDDKSMSKRYKYVPLHQLRPFAFWQEFLKGIPEEDWHVTIRNALKVSSSMTLVDKHRFEGVWPEANVSCGGLFIGPEFICLEDTVRLAPTHVDSTDVTDFLEVTGIKLRLTNLDKASDNDYDEGHPYNSSIFISGRAFTTDKSRSWNGKPTSTRLSPKGMEGYTSLLYTLHDPSKKFRVSFSRILGRCFDAHPMMMWFPSLIVVPPSEANGEQEGEGQSQQDSTPATQFLSMGHTGIHAARMFSSENDRRILPGKTWYWADTRLEALGAETLNNVHSASTDELRDQRLEEWKYIKGLGKRRRANPGGLGAATKAAGFHGLADTGGGLTGLSPRSVARSKSNMAAAAAGIVGPIGGSDVETGGETDADGAVQHEEGEDDALSMELGPSGDDMHRQSSSSAGRSLKRSRSEAEHGGAEDDFEESEMDLGTFAKAHRTATATEPELSHRFLGSTSTERYRNDNYQRDEGNDSSATDSLAGDGGTTLLQSFQSPKPKVIINADR